MSSISTRVATLSLMLVTLGCLWSPSGQALGAQSVTLNTGHSIQVAVLPNQAVAEVSIGFDEVFMGRILVVHSDVTSWSSLVDPTGRVMDLTSATELRETWGSAKRNSVDVPAGPDGEPAVTGAADEYFLNTSALRGQYTLRFGLRAGVDDLALGLVMWRSQSKVGFIGDVGRNVRPNGVPLRISAGLFVNGAAPPNPNNALPPPYPTVTATLVPVDPEPFVGPPVPEVVITLRDDGAAPDVHAADGTFVGDFGLPPAGLYDVRFQASGQVTVDQGGNPVVVSYVRSDIKRVEILGNGGGPAGFVRPLVITDVAQDFEPDGLWNRISLAFPVVVNNPGEYRLAVRIQTAAGQFVLVEGLSSLQAGDQVAVAALQASEIYRLGSAGPFAVKSVELFSMRDGESRLVDAEMDLSHDTQAYDIFGFQRPAFRPIGPTVFTPGDSTGPAAAPYSVLRAELPMIAAFSGHYEYVAQITAHDCAAPVAVARGNFEVLAQNVSAPLEAIRLNMSFDGMSIGTSGVDGPFTLRSLAIHGIGGPAGPGSPGPANSVSVRLTGRDASEFIPASAFVGFTQIADCNGNGVPDTCDLYQLQDVDLNFNGVLDACEVRGCNPADIADTDGNTVLTGGGPDGQLNNGDFSAFFAAYFSSTDCPSLYGNSLLCSAADIANTDGEVHPAWPGYGGPVGIGGGGPDGALDNGDFQAFFTYFLQGCGLSGPSGQGGIEGGGGELMSRILSLLGEGEESIGGINLGALPPAVIAQRIEMLRSLGRPITVEDFKAVAPELFAPPESPDR